MTDTTDDGRPLQAGMVDVIDATGAGPSADDVAFVREFIKSGELNPELFAERYEPSAVAVRETRTAMRLRADWAGLNQYRNANADLIDRLTEVVFVGDSITEIWGVAQPDFFGEGRVNRGVSGQTSPQILLRFMADVVALKPKAVHILCGCNDIAGNTGPTTPDDYKRNILAMTALAEAHGIRVILGALTPFRTLAWRPELGEVGIWVSQLNAWLSELARDRGFVFANYFPALDAGDGSMIAAYTRDGVHPGLNGYVVMRPIAEAAITHAMRKL